MEHCMENAVMHWEWDIGNNASAIGQCMGNRALMVNGIFGIWHCEWTSAWAWE